VVSCIAVNDENRGSFRAHASRAMKPGVILSNTARGALVDEEAMIEALQSGQIRIRARRLNIEPLPVDHPLTKLPNVTLSRFGVPHPGGQRKSDRGARGDCRGL